MRKKTAWLFVFACALILAAVSAAALLPLWRGAKQLKPAQLPQTAPQAAVSAAAEEPLHGQIIYDARAILPPQAVLDIQLKETQADTRSGAIITETRQPLSGVSPLYWRLPIKLSALNKKRAYTLLAKISSGDALLFVNAAPTEIDRSRAAYIIRLAKIDGGSNDKMEMHSLIGTQWRAVSVLGKPVESNAGMSMMFDKQGKTDPAGGKKSYQVSGSGGCNRYMTEAIVNEADKSLKFAPLSAGFIACIPAIANREADFTVMMSKVRAYKIDESGILYLLDEGQNPLARFTAR